MVFQSFNLFPHLTVLENAVLAPTIVKKVPKAQAERNALDLLAKVGLSDRAEYYPSQLSGGQQQRAAIARALAMAPRVMLYDEPTSALDPSLVDEVLSIMRRLDDEGMTQIVVTHEMRFARDVADKIMVLNEGEIIEEGPPQDVFRSPSDEHPQIPESSYGRCDAVLTARVHSSPENHFFVPYFGSCIDRHMHSFGSWKFREGALVAPGMGVPKHDPDRGRAAPHSRRSSAQPVFIRPVDGFTGA
jgi:ABC-type transporter Mla maintaining outer membrane lipid asymmetry ATPase subunit MlaF